ncbi:hypothetical protein Vadar_012315 [Vaccinium darrowii]|uniref:Uncharacterized protein n=1 Tax=Vaccinium darrowii TaxID=229202 RepID=A0ACB7ZIK7_9ERIC|nr:hypothetical protein Vadar_012315 [Vaccinium darrowii]
MEERSWRKEGIEVKEVNDWISVNRGRKHPLVFNNKELITLFVDNIPEEANRAWLSKTFTDYGIVKETYIPAKRSNRGSRFGFVHYDCPISAEVAVTKASGLQVGDYKLFVKVASFNSKLKRDNGNHLRSSKDIAESSYKGALSWKKAESNHLAQENSYAHATFDKEEWDSSSQMQKSAAYKVSTAFAKTSPDTDLASHNAMMEQFVNLHGECKDNDKGKQGNLFMKSTNSSFVVNKEGIVMENNLEGSLDSLVPDSVDNPIWDINSAQGNFGLDLVPFGGAAQVEVDSDLSESHSNTGESNGICSQINLRPSQVNSINILVDLNPSACNRRRKEFIPKAQQTFYPSNYNSDNRSSRNNQSYNRNQYSGSSRGCQICGKSKHLAYSGYHRQNLSYKPLGRSNQNNQNGVGGSSNFGGGSSGNFSGTSRPNGGNFSGYTPYSGPNYPGSMSQPNQLSGGVPQFPPMVQSMPPLAQAAHFTQAISPPAQVA